MSSLSSDEVRPHVMADALRRHPLLIIGCAIVVAVLVALFTRGQPVAYTSSAKVLIRPTIGNPFAPDSGSSGQQVTIAMETESQVVNSAPVAVLAQPKLKGPWVAGSTTVTASVPPNTQVVQISFTAPTPEAAQVGAQVVAQAYLDYRSAQSAATQESRRDILTKQAAAVQASLAAASKAASAANAPPEAAQQVQLFANQLVSIQTSISTLESSGADPGSIISPASLPTAPDGLSPAILMAGGVLIGLAGGVALAVWRERRDKHLRARTDTSVGRIPVLGYVASSNSVEDATEELAGPVRRRGRLPVDGPRALFQRLSTATLTTIHAPATISVSAIADAAQAGYVALNLARALHRAGYSITLVSADDNGWLESQSGLEASQGLGEALSAPSDTRPFTVEVDGLRILPAGQSLGDVEALLFSERFTQILRGLQEDADYVIVSTPNADSPAGMAVGVATDTMILVGVDRRTTAIEVESVAVRAERLGVRIMGLVALPLPRRTVPWGKRSDAKAGTRSVRRPLPAEESGASANGTDGPQAVSAPGQGGQDGFGSPPSAAAQDNAPIPSASDTIGGNVDSPSPAESNLSR